MSDPKQPTRVCVIGRLETFATQLETGVDPLQVAQQIRNTIQFLESPEGGDDYGLPGGRTTRLPVTYGR